MPVTDLVTKPVHTGFGIGRSALRLSFRLAGYGVRQATGLVQQLADRSASTPEAYPAEKPAAKLVEATVEVAVDEFGAVGSLTDNTGVEPDGSKPPFPGYDKLSGDRVMAHVTESTDLPDLQVLLAYEEANKNRKGVVQAVEARLAALGAPVS